MKQMHRSTMRNLILTRVVIEWQDSEYVKDNTFTNEVCKMAVNLAISRSDNEEQFTQLRDYYNSLSEKGLNRFISQVRNQVFKLRAIGMRLDDSDLEILGEYERTLN